MSLENVEIVRRLYDTVARRDAAAVLDLYDREVEWDMSRGPLAGLTAWGIYRGHEGVRRFFRERGTNASIWTIRDGKIVRVVWFGRRDEALEAAGLSE
jgi:ketosteroid isomerase-like protein